MDRYTKSNNPLEMLSEYAEMMTRYAETMQKLDEIEAEELSGRR